MIELPTVRTPPKRVSPKLLILFGQQKVGKTTKIAELDNCLIIDTEKGTDFVECMNVSVNSLAQFYEVADAIVAKKIRYKYIVLDTVDNIANWVEQEICAKNKVPNLIDMAYGAGYNLHREGVLKAINTLKRLSARVIVVGHRKKSILGEDAMGITEVTLDISGKLKNMMMADADAIGYVHRTGVDDKDLNISFKAANGVDAGSRCDHLRNQNIPFEWDKIYID